VPATARDAATTSARCILRIVLKRRGEVEWVAQLRIENSE
jgi:hypothetical protein